MDIEVTFRNTAICIARRGQSIWYPILKDTKCYLCNLIRKNTFTGRQSVCKFTVEAEFLRDFPKINHDSVKRLF